ncbi:transcriptional regulator [Aurantiacibacter poecillastricola]|uniref:transcriptional regulator n=1 Tax=Aurantiacibacter poecillastricola TaxID=3064385 RepID=UPI00273EE410|nr:transcriptional regulator [Aurantiacibacter sp. 219JJ12-13]MDP5262505.1 transcriptional regulator [Aurantiacibacter sp. 219JJ12-13]
MSHHVGRLHGRSIGARQVFPARSRAYFAASYPEGAHKMTHDLVRNPLLELDALALLAEALPSASVTLNRGDLPIDANGRPVCDSHEFGKTIREMERTNCWIALTNIEHDPSYRALLYELLDELADVVEPCTGEMLTPKGCIFISSPFSVSPIHLVPEHNFFLQLGGSKSITIFPADDSRIAADMLQESVHASGVRKLSWNESFAEYGVAFPLAPGDAFYVPVMAPHFVRNGSEPSISLSIMWQSRWSREEADARAFNALLRRRGYKPKATRRWPRSNRLKALGGRIARRLQGFDSPAS